MNSEEGRLRSFQNWPGDAPVDKKRMAQGGLFYLGRLLHVQCFSCHMQIYEWNHGDQVIAKHRALNPTCQFVRDPLNSGNIPLGHHSSLSDPESQPIVSQLSRLEVSPGISVDSRYRTEEARLQSFSNWPKTHVIQPTKLVESGFFYTQMSDKVQCAFCGVTLMDWEPDYDPHAVHIRLSPSCGFLISKASSRQGAIERGELAPSKALDTAHVTVYCQNVPHNPAMSNHLDRLNTFSSWPKSNFLNPEEMADAGFYFLGQGDLVECFYCGRRIQSWERTDNPWKEHARWERSCGYVWMRKGQDVNAEEERRPNPRPARVRTVTEEEVQEIMSTNPIARAVLEIGIQASLVKKALKDKLEQTGIIFKAPEDLINAALDVQCEELPLSFGLGSRKQDSSSDESEEETDPRPPTNPVVPDTARDAPPPKSEEEIATPTSEAKHAQAELDPREKELLELKATHMCKICFDKEICILFVPCHHLVTCIDCGRQCSSCPICRREIDKHIRTYLS